MAKKVLLSWSGGKDSLLTLHCLREEGEYEVAVLVTTFTETDDRVGMHAVRKTLIDQQVGSLGIPLCEVPIPQSPPNKVYEDRLYKAVKPYLEGGIDTIAYGDLFLRDIRAYRETAMRQLGMRPIFPIWRRDTAELAREFLALGYRAVVVSVDGSELERSLVGRAFDERFLEDLPPGVDPCGENGEFHTFVFGGPLFREAVEFSRGEVISLDGFHYCDLLPAGE